MTRLAVAVLVLVAHIPLASADSPFAVLTNPKATWTYDLVKGKKQKPTAIKATIAVTGVHTAGAYTSIEFDMTLNPEQRDSAFYVQAGTWIIGPEGLREVLYFKADENGGYTEEYLASAYKDHYVPRAYLQTTPAIKKKLHWKLDRFGDEDREYNATGSISKPNAHTWRTAWKGSYVTPETGEKDAYAWTTEFDPAIGFTQICTEGDFCLRLVAP